METATTTPFSPLTAMAGRLVRLMTGSHGLGWADQAIVSITSFLPFVMIGRWTDPHQLGIYAVGVSILALLLATQESLITRPYSVHLHHPDGTPEEFAFNALILSVLFAAATAVVIGALTLIFYAFGADRELLVIGWVLAGAAPFLLLRDFARRYCFAHLVVGRALALDGAVAALTIPPLALLGWHGALTVTNTLAIMGAACAVCSFGWLYLTRRAFARSVRQIGTTASRNWRMGKWFLSGQLAEQAQGYLTPWLALGIAGAAVTGVFAACSSIVAFTNPVLYGFFNVLLPKFVLTLRDNGVAALRRQACMDAALLAVIMGAFTLVVFVYGDDILRLLYGSESYAGYGHVLVVLAAAALVGAVAAPAAIALAAAERAKAAAYLTALTAAVSVGLIAALLLSWGLLGAAYGLLTGEIIGCVSLWGGFFLLVPTASPSAG